MLTATLEIKKDDGTVVKTVKVRQKMGLLARLFPQTFLDIFHALYDADTRSCCMKTADFLAELNVPPTVQASCVLCRRPIGLLPGEGSAELN